MPSGFNKRKPQPSYLSRRVEAMDRVLQRAAAKGGWLSRLVHMGHLLVLNIRRTQITRMAAALSYRTIFGVIPMLVIVMLVIASFASEPQVRELVTRALGFTGLSQVIEQVEHTDEPEVVMNPELVDQTLPGDPSREPPSAIEQQEHQHHKLDQWIGKLFKGIHAIPSGPIGLIGMLILVYAALSMMVEIEKAFNHIFNAPEGRSWARRVTRYWTLLTLGTIFLVMTFFVQERIMRMALDTAFLSGFAGRPFLLQSLGFFVTTAISTMLLLMVYLIVPNTRVQFLPALMGALFAAILWESGKWGFSQYLVFVSKPGSGYSRLYGALAIVPLFMLWVYVTWMIVLMGLQLTSALQTNRVTSAEGLKFSMMVTFGLIEDEATRQRVKIVDPAAVLVVVTAVAERFDTGQTSDHSNIAEKTGIDEQAVADMLDRLAGAGLLLRVEGGDREGTYTLTRPPESMDAIAVLDVAKELLSVRESHTPLLDKLSKQRSASLEGKTVADLMDNRKAPAPKPEAGAAIA